MICERCKSEIVEDEMQATLKKNRKSTESFYCVNGQILFPVYANDGGLSTKMIFYIHKRIDTKTMLVLPVWHNPKRVKLDIIQAAKDFNSKARVVSANSAELGLPR